MIVRSYLGSSKLQFRENDQFSTKIQIIPTVKFYEKSQNKLVELNAQYKPNLDLM